MCPPWNFLNTPKRLSSTCNRSNPSAVITPTTYRGRSEKIPDKQHGSNRQLHSVPSVSNSDWMFYDVARILVKGGSGGNGVVAFRREKGVPRGGPAGGSGGSGGSIKFIASNSGNTLSAFRGGVTFRAQPGTNGSGKSKHGQSADDLNISVPLGTVVRADDGKVLADLSHEGDTFLAARGGRGGRGNAAFKTDQNRAPRLCEPGEPGVERRLRLELKLVADVGLVGFPNAGKSAILDAVSNARPKIADYPFTTIVPNLGVVDGIDGANGLVIADVPGLISGAHRGVGMGLAFLRHVERCKVIVHIIDGSEKDMVERYLAIRKELELFGEQLSRKKEVLLINKLDLPGVREAWEETWKDRLLQVVAHRRIAVISAKSREGLPTVMTKLRKLVETTVVEDDIVVLGDEDEEEGPPAAVEMISPGVFRVSGHKVKLAFYTTNWDYIESIDRFQRVLEALGVNRSLIKAGAKDGDCIVCFDKEFSYYKEENIYSAAAALDGYVD